LCFPIVRFAILAEDIHVSHNIDVGFAVLAEAAQGMISRCKTYRGRPRQVDRQIEKGTESETKAVRKAEVVADVEGNTQGKIDRQTTKTERQRQILRQRRTT